MTTEQTSGRPEAEDAGEPQQDDLADLSVETMRAKVEEAREHAQRHWQQFLHSAADLENYKKQAVRDRQDAVERTRRQMLSLVLSVLDNLDRALAFGARQDSANKALVDGLRMTQRQVLEQLAAMGVRPIESTGKPFDPRLHEAVAVVPPQDPDQAGGTVASEVLRGYLLNDDVLRPAKVTVVEERTTGTPMEGRA